MKYGLTAIALLASCTLAGQSAGNDRRRELSTIAANLVAQTDVARQAIAHRDTAAAQSSVRQALTFAGQIQSTAPAAEPLMVPIYTEFDTVSTLVPARKNGANRLKKNAEVSEVTGTYAATILNVTVARHKLLAAQTALDSGDLDAADTDLAAVEGAVTTKNYSGELPLIEARQNLAIARMRVQAGDYKNAILPLKSAARALDRFALKHPSAAQTDRAEAMRLEMDAYAERIGKDHVDALSRVTGWWDQVTDWFNSGMAE